MEQELDVLFQYYVLLLNTITALLDTCTVFFSVLHSRILVFHNFTTNPLMKEQWGWCQKNTEWGSKADSFSSHCETGILLLCRFLKHFRRHHCKTRPFLPFLPMLFHLWYVTLFSIKPMLFTKIQLTKKLFCSGKT